MTGSQYKKIGPPSKLQWQFAHRPTCGSKRFGKNCNGKLHSREASRPHVSFCVGSPANRLASDVKIATVPFINCEQVCSYPLCPPPPAGLAVSAVHQIPTVYDGVSFLATLLSRAPYPSARSSGRPVGSGSVSVPASGST